MQNKVKCKNVQHINRSTWCPECVEPKPIELDYSKISDIGLSDIDTSDYPDVFGYIVSASYDGREITEEELDVLNDDSDYVYECLMKRLH